MSETTATVAAKDNLSDFLRDIDAQGLFSYLKKNCTLFFPTYDGNIYIKGAASIVSSEIKEKIEQLKPELFTLLQSDTSTLGFSAPLPISMKPTIYLAGKALGDKWKLAERAKSIARFVASDGANHSPHDFGAGFEDYIPYSDVTQKDFVEGYALSKIVSCDRLVAYLNTPDSFGSIAEIAFASAHSKDCTLIILDPGVEDTQQLRDMNHGFIEHESDMHDAYWFVSCLPRVRAIAVKNAYEAQEYIEDAAYYTAMSSIYNSMRKSVESPIEAQLFEAIASGADRHQADYDGNPFLRLYYKEVEFQLRSQVHVELPQKYRLDFLIQTPTLKLAVEADGHDFHEKTKEQAQRDKQRDRALIASGYTVLRFTGSEIHRDAEAVAREILEFVKGSTGK